MHKKTTEGQTLTNPFNDGRLSLAVECVVNQPEAISHKTSSPKSKHTVYIKIDLL